MALSVLAASGMSGVSSGFDPFSLFMNAGIVVQAIMVGLVIASFWVWVIIFGFWLRAGRLERGCALYEADFWERRGWETMQADLLQRNVPSARIAAAGMAEWRRSTTIGKPDRDGTRERLALAIDDALEQEVRQIGRRLNFLATVGSVAPFVGLFGTVWGIMNSFLQIGEQQSSSLAVVAPGISEALLATAIGLFAAIPAVIGYNRGAHRVDDFDAGLQRFGNRLLASLSRQLEG